LFIDPAVKLKFSDSILNDTKHQSQYKLMVNKQSEKGIVFRVSISLMRTRIHLKTFPFPLLSHHFSKKKLKIALIPQIKTSNIIDLTVLRQLE